MAYVSLSSLITDGEASASEAAPTRPAEPSIVESVLHRPRPDSLSGQLPAWVRSRSGTATSGRTTERLRFAHAAFFAQATQTAAYKYDNDDAMFLERLSDGMIVAGLCDGVTIPRRHNRAGYAVSSFLRERLRATLVDKDGRRPVVENVLSSAIDETASVLEPLGGGAATTATVVVATPMPTGDWRLYVINAGNSRATQFLPDGTLEPLTRVKPPGTPFAAVNTLSHGYRYKLEMSKATVPAGAILLLTSDGIHDHLTDTTLWSTLGAAIENALAEPAEPTADTVERLTRSFVERLVARATAAQSRAQVSDDATALALLLGEPTERLVQKRPAR